MTNLYVILIMWEHINNWSWDKWKINLFAVYIIERKITSLNFNTALKALNIFAGVIFGIKIPRKQFFNNITLFYIFRVRLGLLRCWSFFLYMIHSKSYARQKWQTAKITIAKIKLAKNVAADSNWYKNFPAIFFIMMNRKTAGKKKTGKPGIFKINCKVE